MRGLLPLATLAFLLPVATPVSADADLDGALFVDANGAYLAEFGVLGACEPVATITVTIHRAGGDDVRQVQVENLMAPEVCFPVSCFECPPVPLPFAWSMKGPGVELVGGGSAYYDAYQNWELAWSLQGPFDEGVLEAHGFIG